MWHQSAGTAEEIHFGVLRDHVLRVLICRLQWELGGEWR
jgi:hypothetical protein